MTNDATSSDKDGRFFFCKRRDVLVFSAVNLVTLQRRVNQQEILL
jgi:hypothetical protein